MRLPTKNGKEPYFDSPYFQETLANHADAGSTRAYIGITAQHDLPIILPPLSEQKAIAEVLSALDDKIDLLQRQNETLEKMAGTLFRQWFIEEAKEDWEEVVIGDLCSMGSGKNIKERLDNGKVPILGANGLIGYTHTALFSENMIYTGRVGTLGVVSLVKNQSVWLSDNTIYFKKIQYFYFVYFQLKRINFSEFNVGSTQPLIRQSDIKEIEVLMPSDKNLIVDFENKVEALW